MVSALLETLCVASILPFMAVVLDPTMPERYPTLLELARSLGANSPQAVVLCLGIITAVALAVGNMAGALNLLVHERFGARTQVRLSTGAFAAYLAQPYAFHMQRDTASLLKVILTDTTLVSIGIINPFLAVVSKALVALGIVALLLWHEPVVALTVSVVLGCAYYGVYRFVRARQRSLGADADLRSLERQRISREALGGLKEILVLGRERDIAGRFEAATRAMAAAGLSNRMAAQLPRYVLESVAFGGILLATLLLLARTDSAATSIVPALALYAFAGYRLMPALHQLFAAALSIRFHMPVLRGMHEDLLLSRALPERLPAATPRTHLTEIRFAGVAFSYPGRDAAALEDIDLVIRPGESVGLVGRSGAGKSTLVDLVLGIHEPSRGSISVNGAKLSGRALREWRRQVGYVPQHIFLANATVAENIAFGLPSAQIDRAAVQCAVHLAQMEELVATLPLGLDTQIGERGVRLSGGQQQRIGIARGLYHDPQVLVFDEATSALDSLTENDLMEAVRALQGERTVIVIAHRVRTIQACGRVVVLERGRIVADGSHEALRATSADYRRLVGHAPVDDHVAAE